MTSSAWNRAVAALGTILFLIVFASTSFAQSAKSTLKDPEQAGRFNDISNRLVCQCGCGMILRVCNHFQCPSAVPMRAKIEEQIVAGIDDDAIVAGFVEEYGKVALATPPPEGIDLAAWVMPGLAILIGFFILFYFIAGWLAKKKLRLASTRAPVDPTLTERIEKELQGMDR